MTVCVCGVLGVTAWTIRAERSDPVEQNVKCLNVMDQLDSLAQQGQRKIVMFQIGKPMTDVEMIVGDPEEGDWTRVIVHQDASACIVESGRGLLLPTPE